MVYVMSDFYKKKRTLKANGQADASIKECLSVRPDEKNIKVKRRQFAKQIADKMHSENLTHKLPSFIKGIYGGKQ